MFGQTPNNFIKLCYVIGQVEIAWMKKRNRLYAVPQRVALPRWLEAYFLYCNAIHCLLDVGLLPDQSRAQLVPRSDNYKDEAPITVLRTENFLSQYDNASVRVMIVIIENKKRKKKT